MAANPNDGTTLGTAEVIADEYVDPNIGVQRREPNLPVTGYKLPRSKIAVGTYGQDWGDAAPDQPLATESRIERQLAELESIRSRGRASQSLSRYAAEQVTLIDSRGQDMATRGTR